MNSAIADSIERWLKTNPLYCWRTDKQISVTIITNYVGVSRTMVNKWEGGSSRPNPANMQRLASLTQMPDFDAKWDAWLALNPSA